MNWLSQMLMQQVGQSTYTPTLNPLTKCNQGNEKKRQMLIDLLRPHLLGRWLSVQELMILLGRDSESGVRESVQKMVDRGLAVRRTRKKTGSAGREVIEYTWL